MTKFDPQKHHRKSIRLQGYDYSQAGAYFVTIVTHQRECLFGKIENEVMSLNDFGNIADECWLAIPQHFPNVELGAYVVMPNHVHGVIVICDDVRRGAALLRPYPRPHENPHKINVTSGSLGAIVRSYKSAVSYRINKEYNATGIWQRNYYEHIIRNEQEMDNIWRYIEFNPAQWNQDDENPLKKLNQPALQITRFNHPDENFLTAVLSLRAEFGDNDSPEIFVNFVRRRLEDETMLLIIAWDGKIPTGYGLAFDVEEHPYMPEWTRAGYIAQFLVSENYRGRGVGKILMDEIDNWFDARGIKKVLLNVNIDNEAGNRFWKNHGFEPYATRMKRIR